MKQRENRSLLKNYKLVMAFILGLIVASGGVYAATTIAGNNITYSNSKSGLNATNVQGAIDELYDKAKNHCPDGYICKRDVITKAYVYNQNTDADNYCITGEENTCERTTCYESKTTNSCPAGTIIKYKVNSSQIETFHVMFDEGKVMTMQSQSNIVNDVAWISKDDYLRSGGSEDIWKYTSRNNRGPLTALAALENATKDWSNVNDQTYTLGTTNLSGKGAYTGCNSYNSCTTNVYTLPERTAKSRLMTTQEASALGCDSLSCPKWLSSDNRYWLSSAVNSVNQSWAVGNGLVEHDIEDRYGFANLESSRAVVVVSK